MKIKADSPEQYLELLPEERKGPFSTLRSTILQNIPEGFEEMINYGMLGYVVPHSIYPSGYHCDPQLPLPFINIASQKNFIAFYHLGIYADKELLDWFVDEYPKFNTNKLDMGKSCIRFKNVSKIPYELIAQLVKKISCEQWITMYESNVKTKK